MGKNKRKNKGQHSQNQSKKKKTNPGQGEKKQPSKTSFELGKLKKPLANSLYPPPFPKDLPIPKDDFLTYTGKYKESFARAIDTCYEGFAVDKGPSSSNDEKDAIFNNERIQQALNVMDAHGLFRTDVTQPFGLGTKCAKTYVTRCLLGEDGTTYKYLGLRMFAYPWSPKKRESEANKDSEIESLDDALTEIGYLNKTLTNRTEIHLKDLESQRRDRSGSSASQNGPLIRGRAKFDVALINRMVNSPDLKLEPTQRKDKCSVSWHADSSLEHYSSIAVYQTYITEENGPSKIEEENKLANKWSIALRVAHDSEGPSASRRGTSIDAAVITDTPAIKASLPSRSAYYLLDDFNHHHQHAVLCNNENIDLKGVRYASTHRLLRESHNILFVLDRCKTVINQFNKKGPKQWTSEQLLLTHIESEWIRQFYIQGSGHKENLWKYWEEPICQLLKYWSQLENRTNQVIELLCNASMARCGMHEKKDDVDTVPSRQERKRREKQKKALASIEDLLNRNSNEGSKNVDAYTLLFEPICLMLKERTEMRVLFTARASDGVFHSLDEDYHPLPIPFCFDSTNHDSKGKECALSPLPRDLSKTCEKILKYGKAFMSRNPNDLPPSMHENKREKKPSDKDVASKPPEKSIQKEIPKGEEIIQRPITTPDDHKKSLTWKGWRSCSIGLEMQEPWAGKLLNGEKKIETRAYDLPKALIGKKIDILQSQKGKDAVSSMPDVLVGNEIDSSLKRIGWCMFDKVIVYRYKAKFESDEDKHLVKAGSGYSWNKDTKVIYGWVVKKYGLYSKGKEDKTKPKVIIRRMRSLFELKRK